MLNGIKNKIIIFLIRHTYLNALVCYEIVKNINKDEMLSYYSEYERKEKLK